MKKAVLALPVLLLASAAHAGQITSRITDSVQLTVEGAAVQATRIGSSYGVSGSNVTMGGSFGLDASSAYSDASPVVTNDGQAFSFSESFTAADTAASTQTQLSNNGRFDTPVLYGDSVTQVGGSAGTLAGSLSTTGVPTVTAGGPGTTATGQRTIELSVFK